MVLLRTSARAVHKINGRGEGENEEEEVEGVKGREGRRGEERRRRRKRGGEAPTVTVWKGFNRQGVLWDLFNHLAATASM